MSDAQIAPETSSPGRTTSRGVRGRLNSVVGDTGKFLAHLQSTMMKSKKEKQDKIILDNQIDEADTNIQKEDPFRESIMAFVEHWSIETFMMILTVYALFGADGNQMIGGKEYDNAFGWISLVVMAIFLLEIVLTSIGKAGYLWGAYFWLDLLAGVSLIGDVPWFNQEVLGNSFAAARAGRASKAGTRAARVVRVIRLIRLTRLIRLMQVMREEGVEVAGEDTQLESEEKASAISNRLSELTTAKVIIGLLLMLLAIIYLNLSAPDDTMKEGLQQFKKHIEYFEDENLYSAECDQACLVERWRESALDFVSTYSTPSCGRGDTCCVSSNVLAFRYKGIDFDFICDDRTIIPNHARIELLRTAETERTSIPYNDTTTEEEYLLVVDMEDLRDEESVMSMYSTLFIIGMLLVMMLSFQAAYGKVNKEVVDPLITLTNEMAGVSILQFEKTKMEPSDVVEVREIQKTFLMMKSSLMSFALFAPRDVVIDMLSSGKEAELSVQSQDVTVFFSHIDNFGSLNEKTSSKKDLLLMLSKYFDVVADAIAETEGTLLDFIGDMVLAIWNAPHAVAFHSTKAMEAVILMREHINESPSLLDHNGEPIFEVSCGVNAGMCFVGNIGASVRMKYTVIGDPVNLASRVGGLNSRYHTFCVVTEAIYHSPQVLDKYLLCSLDCVTVKGKSVGVRVFELVGRKKTSTLSECQVCEIQNEAMKFYYRREFESAVEKFQEVLEIKDSRAAQILKKRCEDFIRQPPPPDWDGAEKMLSKHFH